MRLLLCKKVSQQSNAFTLVELLITVSIMVISLAVGAVNYLRFLDQQKLYQSGASVEAILKDARLKAQNGFLGTDELGYCAQLKAVEVFSSQVAGQVQFTAQLHCASDHLLVYDNYVVPELGTTLTPSLTVAYLPVRGATLTIGGSNTSSGSATLERGNGSVTFNLDQGGVIDVQYE
jgi:prepilin-type N-terminal cleavage/methylation domain-containing protein